MNVGELIRRLSELDPDVEVQTEGCDCWGDVTAVEFAPCETVHLLPKYAGIIAPEVHPAYVLLKRGKG